jgi:hypothetical protein
MKWPTCTFSRPPPARWIIQATRMSTKTATTTQNRVHNQRGRLASMPVSYPEATEECEVRVVDRRRDLD